ncbi:hypothetical protein [Cellvibrio fontiphilus]|uniref:Lipocalin-like domain-containing protein n=1 Tax=Cellvibrio fontiphilus TaxID=1815559 RepID=A0ABV7FIX5_9GAMM
MTRMLNTTTTTRMRLRSLVLGAIFLQLLGCTTVTQQPKNITTPFHTSDWQTELPKEGTARISFSLPQYATAEIRLLKGKSEPKKNPATVIRLTDENCTLGHLTSVSTFKNYAEKIHYFEQEAAWNNNHSLTLSWNKQGKLSVQLNGEQMEVSLERDINRLHITSAHKPVYIEQIEFATK